MTQYITLNVPKPKRTMKQVVRDVVQLSLSIIIMTSILMGATFGTMYGAIYLFCDEKVHVCAPFGGPVKRP